MTGNPAFTARLRGARLARTRAGGRHRVGQPGLRHYLDLPGLGEGDDGRRAPRSSRAHRRPQTRWRGSHRPPTRRTRRRPLHLAAQAATTLVSMTGAAVLGVSAFYAATGAGAVALMMVR